MREGEVLGPYRIERELGAGGMGTVYAATVAERTPGLEVGGRVALKVVHAHLFREQGFFRRFLREAELGAAVRHANVVRTYLADALDGRHFLVMEHVEGQHLRGLLHELERVPEELCRHIGREIAKGLAAIHAAGIVHRDLKPENVLITPDHTVKVMDLGVAHLADEALRLSRSGMFVGSVEYAAPEQFGGPEVDARADLHALGVVLYELASGHHPYRAEDFRGVMRRVCDETPRRLGEVNPQLSPFFEEVVHRLLAKDRDERFVSAAELLAVLEEGETSGWWTQRATAIRSLTQRPLRRVRVPRETAVHGREKELAVLRACYDRAAATDGQVVLLSGEAGIGKSRLVDELVGRLRADGEDVNFLFGSYPPGGAATAAGAFSSAYREQFGDAGARAYLPRIPLLVPAFDALLRGDAAPSGAEPLSRDAVGTCFVQATRALAAERPTIVLVDDLHFAPEEARSLFAALALAAPGHRLLLVGTTRPGLPENWVADLTRLEHATHVELPRLGPKDLAALLADAFGSKELAEDLAFRIAVKSDGNPFFVFEILRGLREGQFITQRDDGSWASSGVIDEIRIPSSVLDLVNARVASLTEEERELLDVAACWGFEFDGTLVGDSLGHPRVPTLRRFALIEKRHRLVRCAGERFVFDHHQVQEALYGALPPQLAREYHAALAGALEARAGGPEADPASLDGAVCVDLCSHLFEGGEGPRALRYLDAALTHLETGAVHDRAADLAARALAAPGLVAGSARIPLLLRLADRLDLLGRRPPQRAALEEAIERAREASDRAAEGRALGALGRLLSSTGRHAEAREHHERHIAIAQEIGDRRQEAAATANLGVACWAQGRHDEAHALYERGLALAREAGDRDLEARITGNLGNVQWSRGRFDEARALYERNVALARETGNRRSEAVATGNLGGVLWAQGRYAEALAHIERRVAMSREAGDRRGEASALGGIGSALASLGRFEESREHFARQMSLARETGDVPGESNAAGGLGVAMVGLGRLGESLEHSRRRIALDRRLGDRRSECVGLANAADALLGLGRLADAEQESESALRLAREIGYAWAEGHALFVLANVAAESDDFERAERLLGEALALRRDAGARAEEADTLAARGAILARAGRHDAARADLEAAVSIAREIGLPRAALSAAAQIALLPGGDPSDALDLLARHGEVVGPQDLAAVRLALWTATGDRSHLAAAHALNAGLLSHAPADCRATMCSAVRLHREILAAWRAEFGEDGATA